MNNTETQLLNGRFDISKQRELFKRIEEQEAILKTIKDLEIRTRQRISALHNQLDETYEA